MMVQKQGKFKLILELSKVKITVAVALTTITGYVLGKGAFSFTLIATTLGIFLLACGASVLNHIQEMRSDAIMPRTKNRPLPAGTISKQQAWFIALIELSAGAVILFIGTNPLVLILGLLALVWYNLIYTNLKRITPHAVIPGSVIGAIPPLVGWTAAGASLADPRAWAMAFFFFVWQVPHFYLLVMKYGGQYEKAGLPALTGRYSEKIIRLIIFMWVVATSIASLFLIFFNLVHSGLAIILLLGAAISLNIVFAIPLINPGKEFRPFVYFMRINYYVLFMIVLLNIESLCVR